METPHDLKVIKKEIPVKILLDDLHAGPEEYLLFLSYHSRSGSAQETISEYLNHQQGFIPARVTATNSLILLNLQQVVYVLEKEPQSLPVQKRLCLTLKNDHRIEVDHFKKLPDGHCRLLDYLNEPDSYHSFLREGALIHVNKKKIIRSEEYELH